MRSSKWIGSRASATFRLFAAIAALALLAFAAPAEANTRTPTRFDDPSGPGTCPSDCSLRQEIASASSGDTIQLQTGTYMVTQGQLTLPNGKDLTIVGNGALNSQIDGNNNSRVFEIPGGTASTDRLANLTIQHGKGTAEAGGISVFTGTLTLDAVTVTNNTGTSNGGQNDGGGVQVGTDGTLVMTNSTVSGNVASDGTARAAGGGIFNDGTATITNSTISANRLNTTKNLDGNGAGLSTGGNPSLVTTLSGVDVANNDATNGTCGGVAEENGKVTISNSVIEGNSSKFGAGLCEEGGGEVDVAGTAVRNNFVHFDVTDEGGGAVEDGGGKLSFTNSSITGNTAEFGAGVSEDGGGLVVFTNTTITGNHAQTNPGDRTTIAASENGGGGGIGEDGGGTVRIARSTISGNTADGRGGGIQADGGSQSFAIVDSTIADNSASLATGGVRIDHGDVVSFLNDTVSGNAAPGANDLGICEVTQAGDTHCDGHMSLENTIVSSATAANCATSGGSDISIDSHGHNLDSGSSCGLSQGGDLRNANPLLGPLQGNGGSTQTEALGAGSPAIDAGDDSVCGNADGLSGPNDQRDAGFPRIGGPACDIGAFEVQPAAVTAPPAVTARAPLAQAKATRPTIHVAGVPRGCVRSTFRLTVTITSSVPLTLVKAARDRQKLKAKSTSGQHLVIDARPLKAGRHSVKISARNIAGTATRTIRFVRCAVRRAASAPRFTG